MKNTWQYQQLFNSEVSVWNLMTVPAVVISQQLN